MRRRIEAGILALLASGTVPAQQPAEPDAPAVRVRDTLDRWLETRKLISQEKRDWALGRGLLADRIELLEREVAAVRERIAATAQGVADATAKQTELQAERDRLVAEARIFEESVGGLERRVAALARRLPEPLREKIRLLQQRIPADPRQTKLSLAERYQNVVGILNEVDKFHAAITTASEVRTLRDGSSVQVTAVYLGIARGYYVSSRGDAAGIGSAEGGEWTWTAADHAAPQIARVIAILGGEQPAGFVRLPLR